MGDPRPSTSSLGLIDDGHAALGRGAWAQARESFEAALAEEESPEALEGLGRACWWLDDVPVVLEARERAYRLYRDRGDGPAAARIALHLAEDAMVFRMEEAVSNGWRQRAQRLLEGMDPCPEHGFLAAHDAFFAYLLMSDTVAAQERAAEAMEIARRFGMVDLEMFALSIQGVSLVNEGRVEEGMHCLDEATAAATGGEMDDIELIGLTCCFMIFACEHVRDFDRAAQWCERVKAFCRRFDLDSLLGVCRTHHATVLAARGEWDEAEQELLGATQQLAQRPAQAMEGVARLGELRRRQGRLDEARTLFDTVAFFPEAQLGHAALALDIGDRDEAAEWAERFLSQVPEPDRTQRARGFELLAIARAGLGELEAAHTALRTLEEIAGQIGTDLFNAASALAGGVVAHAQSDHEESRRMFQLAVDLYERTRLTFEAAEARLMLSQALAALGRRVAAAREARRALETFTRLDASHAKERASALLSELETEASDAAPARSPLSPRETEVLKLVADGLSDKEIASRLTVSEHTVHRHVANIMTKLGSSSRAAAAVHAAKRSFI